MEKNYSSYFNGDNFLSRELKKLFVLFATNIQILNIFTNKNLLVEGTPTREEKSLTNEQGHHTQATLYPAVINFYYSVLRTNQLTFTNALA